MTAPHSLNGRFTVGIGAFANPSAARTTPGDGCLDGIDSRRVRFRPICATVCLLIVRFSADRHSLLMRTLSPLTLTPEDKIDALRQLDEFHFWHSLDDVRICQRCHRQITGRQIEIVGLPGTRGALRLQCPTPDCESSPGEWIYADPVLAASMRNHYPLEPELAS